MNIDQVCSIKFLQLKQKIARFDSKPKTSIQSIYSRLRGADLSHLKFKKKAWYSLEENSVVENSFEDTSK